MSEVLFSYPDIYKWGTKIASEENFTDSDLHTFAKEIIAARILEEGKDPHTHHTILMNQYCETISLRYFVNNNDNTASLIIQADTSGIKAAIRSEYCLGLNGKAQYITKYEEKPADPKIRRIFPRIPQENFMDLKERVELAKAIWDIYLDMLDEEKAEIQEKYRKRNEEKGIVLKPSEESVVIYPIPEKLIVN